MRIQVRAALKLSTEMFILGLGAVFLDLEHWLKLSLSSTQHAKPLLCLELGATLSTAADPASWSLHILVPQLALGPIACPVLLSPPRPLCDLIAPPRFRWDLEPGGLGVRFFLVGLASGHRAEEPGGLQSLGSQRVGHD